MGHRWPKVLVALLLAVAWAALAGCRLGPDRRRSTRAEPATPRPDYIPPLPPPELPPPPVVSAEPAVPAPILEAAFERDEAIRRVALDAIPPPEECPSPRIPLDGAETASAPAPQTSGPAPDALAADIGPFTSDFGRKPASTRGDEASIPPERRPIDVASGPPEVVEEISGGLDAMVATMAEERGESEGTEAPPIPIGSAMTAAPAPFSITSTKLCHKVFGRDQFQAIEPGELGRGEPFLIYAGLEGLSTEGGAAIRSRLTIRVEILSPGQDVPIWSVILGDERTYPEPPPRDGFLNCRLSVPKSLSGGRYRLRMVVRDQVAGREAEASLPLAVRR